MKLIRANYSLLGRLHTMDFVGELAERELYSWIVETAKENDSFQYLGKLSFDNPICFKYNRLGHIELWNGLLPISEPDLYIEDFNEIDEFFNDIGIDVQAAKIDVVEICNDTGYFTKQLPQEDELLIPRNAKRDITASRIQHMHPASLDFLEEPIPEVKKVEEIILPSKKREEFEEWFRTFIEEKDLEVVQWSFDKKGYIDIHMDNYDMVETIIEKCTDEEQAKIKEIIVMLDLHNGDINHFLHHLAEGYVEQLPELEEAN